MDWYYAVGGERKGPVSEEEFRRLVQQGVVTSQTLVWREGMVNWQPHGAGAVPPVLPGAAPGSVVCTGCGRVLPGSEVIPLGGGLFCAACKPLAVQRLREGTAAMTSVEEIRNEHLKHEASVKSVGVLYYLGGGALMVFGIVAAVPGMTSAAGVETIFLSLFFLLLGVGQIWVGAGLRRLRKWARIPTGILSGIGLIGFPLGTLINAYILYLVFSRKGTTVFSDEYRAVIEQTPHIKYRTSILVWILLGILLLLVGFGIFAAVMARLY